MKEYLSPLINILEANLLLIDINKYTYNDTDVYIFTQNIPNKLLLNPNIY